MKNKKSFFGISISDAAEKMQQSGPAFFLYAVLVIVFMGLICVAVFFASVKGEEEVMVPQVVGKDLNEALLEMQVKELYPKIILRYSDNPDDKGMILDQTPIAGSIVKAGKRINLTVSRGTVVDKVEDFKGWNVDDVKSHLKTLFTAMSKPLITLSEPLYEYNSAEAGTVLSQNPPAGTSITDPITLKLVVSRGPENSKIEVPNIVSLSLRDIYSKMASTSLIFDFSAGEAEGNEPQVISQMPIAGEVLAKNSRVEAVIGFPASKGLGSTVYGIFKQTLPEYAYPLKMELMALPPSGGNASSIVKFTHMGGNLTIPYAVSKNTVLILYVEGKEIAQITVRAKED
ncbi:MAG: PASTA domain-containing protein [Treponemataceae bacterium]|nr:PASTA domain-containing protein [Treponemataceae bacterium]